MTDILDELAWRGLLAHHTDLDELRSAFAAGPVTFYGGFDPTAPGLHIGNLLQVSSIEALPTTRLYELWLEQKLFNEKFSIRVGQMAADTEFQKAADDLKKLQEKLLSGKMTEADKKALQEQLGEMAKQLEKLANFDQRRKQHLLGGVEDSLDLHVGTARCRGRRVPWWRWSSAVG